MCRTELTGLLLFILSLIACGVPAADDFTRQTDVVYGRKFGTALTMDVFTPKEKTNGAAVIWVVNGLVAWVMGEDVGRRPLRIATTRSWVP